VVDGPFIFHGAKATTALAYFVQSGRIFEQARRFRRA
jgi:hypothetical protein